VFSNVIPGELALGAFALVGSALSPPLEGAHALGSLFPSAVFGQASTIDDDSFTGFGR
jgi:hypothetical protein